MSKERTEFHWIKLLSKINSHIFSQISQRLHNQISKIFNNNSQTFKEQVNQTQINQWICIKSWTIQIDKWRTLRNSKLLQKKIDDFSLKKLELIDYLQKNENENCENWELNETLMIRDSIRTISMKFNHVEQELRCLKEWMLFIFSHCVIHSSFQFIWMDLTFCFLIGSQDYSCWEEWQRKQEAQLKL